METFEAKLADQKVTFFLCVVLCTWDVILNSTLCTFPSPAAILPYVQYSVGKTQVAQMGGMVTEMGRCLMR